MHKLIGAIVVSVKSKSLIPRTAKGVVKENADSASTVSFSILNFMWVIMRESYHLVVERLNF